MVEWFMNYQLISCNKGSTNWQLSQLQGKQSLSRYRKGISFVQGTVCCGTSGVWYGESMITWR